MYFQLGSMAGGVLGWIAGGPRQADARSAPLALLVGAILLLLSWLGYAQAVTIFSPLSGVAIGYGVAFFVRRTQG